MKGTAQFRSVVSRTRVIQILKKSGLKDIAPLTFWKMNRSGKKLRNSRNGLLFHKLYINEKFIGGADIVTEMYETGELLELLQRRPSSRRMKVF
ncbi:MAG: glutaredoxin [Burkholderiaceae bacterium]|nr:MAG: glutaredoxin [Burkholderiaceae bacterium]